MLSVAVAYAHLTQVHLGAVLSAAILSRIRSRGRLRRGGRPYQTIFRIKRCCKDKFNQGLSGNFVILA